MINTRLPHEVARFLVDGHFKFRLLDEALALSVFLGNICPNPRLHTMAISEILINAIEHGNLEINSKEKRQLQKEQRWTLEIERRLTLPEYQNRYVYVDIHQTMHEMILHVKDDGNGFNWHAFKKANINNQSTQGRGILMAEHLAFKKLEYSEKGNEVTCIIALL